MVGVWNDYDNYCNRLSNIDSTNSLISDIRVIVGDLVEDKRIPEAKKIMILDRIKKEEGYSYSYAYYAGLIQHGDSR